MHIDGSVLIIEPGDTADVILADHNAGNGFYGNCFTCIREFDSSVIVSGNSACIVRSRLPVFHDHVVDRAVVIRKITCTIKDRRTFFIIADDTTHIGFISGSHTVVDTVLQCYIFSVHSDDTADVILADHVACIRRYAGACICG